MEKFKSGASAFWLAVMVMFTLCLTFGSIVHAEDCFTQEQLDDAVATQCKRPSRRKIGAGGGNRVGVQHTDQRQCQVLCL